MMDRPEWIAFARTISESDGHFWSSLKNRDPWGHDDDSHDDWDHRDWGGMATSATFPWYNRRHPLELYLTLTNNNRRGGGGSPPGATSSNNPDGSTGAGAARPAVDIANPRPDNDYGHIVRWREDDNVVTARGFEWDIFVFCGDTQDDEDGAELLRSLRPQRTSDIKATSPMFPTAARISARRTVCGSTSSGASGSRPIRWATHRATG